MKIIRLYDGAIKSIGILNLTYIISGVDLYTSNDYNEYLIDWFVCIIQLIEDNWNNYMPNTQDSEQPAQVSAPMKILLGYEFYDWKYTCNYWNKKS